MKAIYSHDQCAKYKVVSTETRWNSMIINYAPQSDWLENIQTQTVDGKTELRILVKTTSN